MNQNIVNIHNSEERLSYIIDITLRIRTLTLLQQNLLSVSSNHTAYNILLNQTLLDLRASAMSLKNAQTELSIQTAFLP